MKENCDIQIAEFAFPFPAEIFKTEMIDKGIAFREFQKDWYEGGSGSVIFYIANKDFESAFLLKEKIDGENIASEDKHRHPIVKYLKWFFLICAISFLLYQLFEFFIGFTH